MHTAALLPPRGAHLPTGPLKTSIVARIGCTRPATRWLSLICVCAGPCRCSPRQRRRILRRPSTPAACLPASPSTCSSRCAVQALCATPGLLLWQCRIWSAQLIRCLTRLPAGQPLRSSASHAVLGMEARWQQHGRCVLNNASLELYDRIGPGAPCQSCWSWHAQQALPNAAPCRVSENPSSEGTES